MTLEELLEDDETRGLKADMRKLEIMLLTKDLSRDVWRQLEDEWQRRAEALAATNHKLR